MKPNIEKFRELEDDLASEKGSFSLFALFLREESPGKWGLVLTAPWLEQDRSAALQRVASEIQERFNRKELLGLSRIIILDEGSPALKTFLHSSVAGQASTEMRASLLAGHEIEEAYVLASSQPDTTAAALPA